MTAPWWSGGTQQSAIAARPDVQAAVQRGDMTGDQWWQNFGQNEAGQAEQQFARSLPGQSQQAMDPFQARPPMGGGMDGAPGTMMPPRSGFDPNSGITYHNGPYDDYSPMQQPFAPDMNPGGGQQGPWASDTPMVGQSGFGKWGRQPGDPSAVPGIFGQQMPGQQQNPGGIFAQFGLGNPQPPSGFQQLPPEFWYGV